MDREVIERKLEALRRHVERIESKRPFALERLKTDNDLQDVVVLNLIQAIQVSVDIGMHLLSARALAAPETMGHVFDSLAASGIIASGLAARMKGTVGFRNLAVHAYDRIDWAIVLAICETRLEDLREFADDVVTSLDVKREGH